MSTTVYRLVLLALGVALIFVVVAAVILTPDGDAVPLPEAVESVSPADGATVARQTSLVIDMMPGFVITLTVDGVVIPDEEISSSEPLGRYSWTPGPESTFPEWTPGMHAVQIDFRRPAGFPEPGTYRWSFRVL